MGVYAELIKPEYLQAQMVLSNMDCADVARRINAEFGTSGRPQVVSRQFISRLKNGKVRRCTPALATCITTVLNVPLELLFVVRGMSHQAARDVLSGQTAHLGRAG